ncbi:hypothetical protein FRC10_000445 [Ceratobasidium sp. 414]|nr:hypothetical protein FRC10_000445 [Ceratobasidium sp. 414]
MSSDTKNALSIRPATAADRPALSRVCLLTGDAGQSAEPQFHIPELLGLVYAEPYVVVTPCFGFVLVDEHDEVFGYILGTPDTRQFEVAIDKEWYTPLRTQARYSKDPYPADITSTDRYMVNLIHKPDIAPEEIIQVCKAHIHIDLLPRAQRQGWGTRLIGKAVEYLRAQGNDSLYVNIGASSLGCMRGGTRTADDFSDPRNVNGRAFYLAIGFDPRPPSPHTSTNEEQARIYLTELKVLFGQRADAVRRGGKSAARSIEINIVVKMRQIGDTYPDAESKSEWYKKAKVFEKGNDNDKENILMPLAQGLGILIAAPFVVAGGAIFAAGGILYGVGKTVLGVGNLLTGGVFR